VSVVFVTKVAIHSAVGIASVISIVDKNVRKKIGKITKTFAKF
jgi:hypothetical protein